MFLILGTNHSGRQFNPCSFIYFSSIQISPQWTECYGYHYDILFVGSFVLNTASIYLKWWLLHKVYCSQQGQLAKNECVTIKKEVTEENLKK